MVGNWEVTAVGTEYERKFLATPQALTAIKEAYAGEDVQIDMETTYYDTPGGSLSGHRFMLRKRMENGIPVCTLKAPVDNALGEWEVVCESVDKAVFQLLEQGCPKELAALAKEGLVAICGGRIHRIAKTVVLPQGVVELALDNGILFGGQREEAVCEVEVELKSGATEMCDAFAEELAERFGLTEGTVSKFRRALALYKGE